MSNYAYVAIDPRGAEKRGSLDVPTPIEAVRRIKEMGLFPTKVFETGRPRAGVVVRGPVQKAGGRNLPITLPFFRRVKPGRLCVFTRQLATLASAGMPLLRSLRVLQEQEESKALRRVIEEISRSIEEGRSFTEAVAEHPRVFNRLYVSMIKAGEIGGAIEVALTRLAEFIEKAQRIKGRIKAAMFYPCTVLAVALGILGLLMAYVVPRFKEIFAGLMDGRALPAFTRLVFRISEVVTGHLWLAPAMVVTAAVGFALMLRTHWGRQLVDWLKLKVPVLGNVFRKAAISRFARTLGTLISNGVPILQALTIVGETAGNVHLGNAVSQVHENVKQGDPIAPTLKDSPLFPSMVAGMVDVGEQTGALPEMLLKIADNYDEEVNNATNSLTSLLEPVMIIFLAVMVGGIVIAMFLPLVTVTFDGPPAGE